VAGEVRERLLLEADERIAGWERAGQKFVAFFEDDYPQQLATAFDNPLVLFYAGSLADDFASIAIVGSREPGEQGTRFAAALSRIATRAGITVVSGLARGIDRVAHQAALEGGGRTVAVIGTGLDRFYPPEHETLQRRIAADGLVVSQFPPGATPTKATFPMRNATMSAYSALTVIVEAGEKSGTKIQAAAAVKHGRPLVLTRQVANGTTWGRNYIDEGYDVTIAATPDEAMEAVQRVLSRSSRVLQWAGEITRTG
jgi:DNA processing protein